MDTVPRRLHLDREKQLEIDWGDGQKSVFSLAYLRRNCPCASCKILREEQAKPSLKLTILSSSSAGSGPLRALKAELVGNYAIRIDWSDDHGTGIYSFEYLHAIREGATRPS
jgi:DUF971 family protein